MNEKTKERVYLLICVFCVSMCAVLVLSMLNDTPVPIESGASEHVPPHQRQLNEVQSTPGTAERMMITEEYFSKMLSQYLPSGFPAKQISADIDASGIITLQARIARGDIENYLESNGISLNFKQQLMISALPSDFDFSAAFACSTAPDGGTLLAVPEKLAFNGIEIEVGEIPEDLLDAIAAAANNLLLGTDYYFTDIHFTDGAIELTANAN